MSTKKNILLAFLGALGITALYFLWAYESFSFFYDINDDVAMRNVAAGVITGSPDAHLIHIKYIWGLVIRGLYATVPGFDWYGIGMTGLVSLSLAVLLYRGLVMERGWLWKLVYVCGILLVFTWLGLKHLVCFQWTVTAGMIGGAGLFLFVTCQTREGLQSWWEEGASLGLLLLSLCIRDDVFLLVLPAAALVFWYRHGSFVRGQIPFRLNHWQIAAALAGGVLVILGVEFFAYKDPEWKSFLAYNQDREAIMDFYGIPDYQEDQVFYDSMGMREETVVNLHRYSLYLVEDIYPEKMHALAENARELYEQKNPPLRRMGEGVTKVLQNLLDGQILPLTAFGSLLFIALWILLQRQRALSMLVLLHLLWGSCWLYLGYRGRVVDRVVYTLLLLQIFTYGGLLIQALPERILAKEKGTWQNPVILLTLGFCLVAICQIQIKDLKKNSGERWAYNQQFLDINQYMAEHMENVYFMTTFSIETYTDNFTLRRDFTFSNLLSVGGWHSFSQLENKKIEKLGIGGQTMEHAMLTEDHVFVISLVNVDYMDRYFLKKYGNQYQGRTVVDVQTYGDTDFTVYQFSLAE